jgi:hypothetical protein
VKAHGNLILFRLVQLKKIKLSFFGRCAREKNLFYGWKKTKNFEENKYKKIPNLRLILG